MARRPLKKRILNSRVAHFVLSLIMSVLMRAIFITCRVEKIIFTAEAKPYAAGELPAIFCFWHGRMIMQPFLKPPGRTMSVLISHHNDGALITATMLRFGIGSVRGSRKLGSTQALRELFEVTARGGNIAITPDGPRGPLQKAAQGAAYVSAKTGYPILPIAFSATRHWRFKSWDRFMLPKPFSRIVFIVGPMVFATADSQDHIEATTAALETTLTHITTEADMACGVLA
jgi:lysophospholipid acyltransferase (LPLAT)-like uncharacterized protein